MYRRATAIVDKFYQAAERELGKADPTVAQFIKSLAALAEAQDEFGKAEDYYRCALKIQAHILDRSDVEIAGTLGQLAYVRTVRGNYEEAEKLYKRALDIEERTLNPDHPDVTSTLIGLATLYHQQGRDTKAEMFGWRALSVLESAFTRLAGEAHTVAELTDDFVKEIDLP